MNVSVCIPTYNQSAFIENAIKSAYNQTVMPFEIIIFDDCSTDDTMIVLNKLATQIPSLKIFKQKINVGISMNVDACLRAASGELIIRLDSDDCLSPFYIEKLTQELKNNPHAGYAHAAVQEIDQNGNFLKKRILARKSGYQNDSDALIAMTSGFRVAANILMFKKEALEKVGFIVSKTNFAEDYYLIASLAVAGYGNVYLNEVLSYYRVWIDVKQIRKRRKLDEIIGYRKLFEEVLEPAYLKKNWNKSILIRRKTLFACNHADCLASNVFTNEEKIKLKKELYKLSIATRTKIIIWLYLNGFGNSLIFFKKLKFFIKTLIKSIIWRNTTNKLAD